MTTREFEESQLRLDIEAVMEPGEHVIPLSEVQPSYYQKLLQEYFERRD
jgi:hypothetical protein